MPTPYIDKIVTRLDQMLVEPSTYAGLAVLLHAAGSPIPADDLAAWTKFGEALGAVLAIFLREGKHAPAPAAPQATPAATP